MFQSYHIEVAKKVTLFNLNCLDKILGFFVSFS
jgi:hypothetical protein